jgi:hypothetical protein
MKKEDKNKNLPIATEIIKEYKEDNTNLRTINKRLYIIIMALLTIIVLETTYLIFVLDGLNNSVGIIQEEVSQCE